jgi:hypothetical protein
MITLYFFEGSLAIPSLPSGAGNLKAWWDTGNDVSIVEEVCRELG